MRVGIMQPYFFPYLGYYQLINYCDAFVIYDDVKYTKKGWISRNRIQKSGRVQNISLQIQRGSDALPISKRNLAIDFDKAKLYRQIAGAYSQSPFWDESKTVINLIINKNETNLFDYLEYSIRSLASHLGISTPIHVSSNLTNNSLSGFDRVIEICRALDASEYVNPIGGIDLYSHESFQKNGLSLSFIRSKLTQYAQAGIEFIPSLSIIDAMVSLDATTLRHLINSDFEIIDGRFNV